MCLDLKPGWRVMMRTGKGTAGRTATILFAAALLAMPVFSPAAEKGRGPMPGKTGTGNGGGHSGMLSMGEKIWRGLIGPWKGQARLMDNKAQMEKGKAPGMKEEMPITKTHHVAVMLLEAKGGAPVMEGKGTLTVTGPDRKPVKVVLSNRGGPFEADIDLPKPGDYAFTVWIESGGKAGSVSFTYTLK